MKKKSLITMLTALCLTGVVMVGATLAYLSDTTKEVTNVFTVGDVEIEIDEPNWDPENGEGLEYGAEIPKDPQIENTGSNDAYIVMTVTGMTSGSNMSQYGFSATYDTANWVRIDENGEIASESDVLVDGYYMYKTVVESGETTAPLFEMVKFEGEEVEGDIEFNLVVQGHAIQTKGMSVVVDGVETETPDAAKVYTGLFVETN